MFSEKTVSTDPFIQFNLWYREHLSMVKNIPEAMYLATASPGGKVSARTVLLRDHGESGFTFYTNYRSKKAKQMEANPQVALLFYWPEKGRQVRVEGIAEKVPVTVSEEYFSSRPRDSQLAAWASDQSSEIPDRSFLENKFTHYKTKYNGIPVPRPVHWGGYMVIPDLFEFWEDRENRLHDRVEYRKKEGKWIISRLAP